MAFRSRNYLSTNLQSVEPIVKLWILRLLLPLECHRRFIGKCGVESEELATLFELTVEQETDEDSDDAESVTAYNPTALRAQIKAHYCKAELDAASASLPQPLADNIACLAKQIGLSEVESWILAFAVMLRSYRLVIDTAQWLGPELNTLRVYHVLSVLLGFSDTEIRQAFNNQSVLTQTSLVVIDHRESNYLVRKLDLLSSHFADRLLFESGSPMDWLRDMIMPSSAPQLTLKDYPHIQSTLDFLLPYLQQAVVNKRRGVNIFIHGTPGTGKTQLIRVLAQHLACPLYEVTSEDEDGDPIEGEQRLRAFRTAQAFFQNSPAFLLFDEVEDVFNDGNGFFGKKSTAQTHKAWMNRLLEENPVPTFWLGNSLHSIDPAFIRRFDWVIELPIPPKAQRERIIRQRCSQLLIEPTIRCLAACEELAPAIVSRAADVMGSLKDQFPVEHLSTAMQHMIEQTLIAQGHAGLTKDDALRLPAYYDPDLINCDTNLTELVEGIRGHGSARLCLFGAPGTGKSAYSRWLAEELDKPLHVKRGTDLLSMWVGGTEKNIARIFAEAEQDNAVLLIDEVDSFLQDRNTSRHSWEITGVNEILTRMEAYNGIFIASTNRLDGLDSAALRRFDLKVKFDVLKPAQAWKLLQSYCQTFALPVPNEQDQKHLQRLYGLTPGDFAVLARQHRFRSFKEVAQLVMALEAECALKTPHRRQPIGFV